MITSHTLCNERIRELEAALNRSNEATTRAEAELQAAQWALAQWHAEEEDWVRDHETCMEVERLLRLRLEKAEAELAALKGRRCETCQNWRSFTDIGLGVGDCAAVKRFCITNQLHSMATFSCPYWQPLPEARP